jgi:hypothetical protein
MGNTNDGAISSAFDSIKKEYSEVRHDSKGIVLQHMSNQQTFLLKEYTYGS